MESQEFLEDFDSVKIISALSYFGLMKGKKTNVSLSEARKAISAKKARIDDPEMPEILRKIFLKDFEEHKQQLYKYVLLENLVKVERAKNAIWVLGSSEAVGTAFLVWNTLLRENPNLLLSVYTSFSLLCAELLRIYKKQKMARGQRTADILRYNLKKIALETEK